MSTLLAYALELSHNPAHISAYEAHHANPYPEVAQHWRDIGVRSAHIFRLGYRLIMLIEIADIANLGQPWQPAIAPRMREWDELMKAFQIELSEAHYPAQKLGKWTRMQEIYTYAHE
ncbi:MAG: L-rhamnose mutarotase [Chloroflexi bacterium]|nr:L-rhamnose mutarotase [Chloroflexota bacterium]